MSQISVWLCWSFVSCIPVLVYFYFWKGNCKFAMCKVPLSFQGVNITLFITASQQGQIARNPEFCLSKNVPKVPHCTFKKLLLQLNFSGNWLFLSVVRNVHTGHFWMVLTTLNNTIQCFYQSKTVNSFWPVNVLTAHEDWQPIIFSHCVHLKLGHRFHALLKVCFDYDDTVALSVL